MERRPKKIAITGASGQIAYSLLFRIANGDLFGIDQPIELSITDIPETENAMRAIVMELEDCAFPLLNKISLHTNVYKAFEEIDVAFLVGAKPRTLGMERSDLLLQNGVIFVEQGKALHEVANKDVKVLVVGNPCNTNCLIAMHHAPRISRKNFFAMMQLDYNRAKNAIAKKLQVQSSKVKKLIVWGNHSSTQVPDFTHVEIDGKKLMAHTQDLPWFQKDFFELVQKRGAAIIAARGKSSAGSAAHAAIESMRAFFYPSDDWVSQAIISDGNPYGIEEDLVFGFPCQFTGEGHYQIVSQLEWDFFIREKIAVTQKELIEEKKAIQHLL